MLSKTGLALSLLLALICWLGNASVFGQGTWHNPAGGGDKSQSIILYQKALMSFHNEDYTTAINLLQQAIHIDQSNKEIYHLCALAMSCAGDNYNAMLMFQAALTCDYNFIVCRNNYGIFLHKIGKMIEAKQAFQECIKIDQKYAEAHYHLGQILQEQGDLAGAIEEYETATRLNPKYFEAQRDLGLAIYERVSAGVNEINESAEKLALAAKLAPNNPMIHYYLGNIYCAAGLLDEAEAELRIALSCDSKLAIAHYELARLRYYRGDLDRCLLEMQAALKINPTYTQSKKYPEVDIANVQEFMARCNEWQDRLADAVDSWKQVAAMRKDNQSILQHISELTKTLRLRSHKKVKQTFDPDVLETLLMKGIAQAENEEIDQAKSTFNQVLASNSQSFGARQNLGLLAQAQGDFQGAMAQYKSAMALLPKFEGVYYNMAYLLEKMGLPADAGLMYQRFHEIAGRYPYDPKHIVALQQTDARERARTQEIRQRGY